MSYILCKTSADANWQPYKLLGRREKNWSPLKVYDNYWMAYRDCRKLDADLVEFPIYHSPITDHRYVVSYVVADLVEFPIYHSPITDHRYVVSYVVA